MKKIYNVRGGIAGFTLLELVIAITILSFITLIIGSGFRLGINAWEKGDKETAEIQRLRVLSGMLSQQIMSVHPYKMKLKDEDQPAIIFKGQADSLIFVTTITDPSYGGFKWVKYLYRDGNLLYREGLLPDKKLEEKTRGGEEVIDSGIDDIRFAYLSDSGEWKDSWDFGITLPVAVRIKISNYQPFVISIAMGTKEDENKDKAASGQT
jgi:general secretion pathway protein J